MGSKKMAKKKQLKKLARTKKNRKQQNIIHNNHKGVMAERLAKKVAK